MSFINRGNNSVFIVFIKVNVTEVYLFLLLVFYKFLETLLLLLSSSSSSSSSPFCRVFILIFLRQTMSLG